MQQNASEQDLKKAYKKLVVEKHPDKHGNSKEAEEEFSKINIAYDILTGKAKAEDDQPQFSGFPGGVGFNVNDIFNGGFDSIFSEFFTNGGNRGGRPRSQQPQFVLQDLELSMVVNVKQAALGSTLDVDYNYIDFCDACNGQGKETSGTCESCQGTGFVYHRKFANGFIEQLRVPCNNCSKSCEKCSGGGGTHKRNTLKVKMPPIASNCVIRLQGKGNKKGQKTSDLYLNLIIDPIGKGESDGFVLHGPDIHTSLKVKFGDLLMGGSAEVKLIDGNKSTIAIPFGSKLGDSVILNDQGVRGTGGRLVVKLDLKYPNNKALSPEIKEALDKLYSEDHG